ncbi:MAG: hypothetical protein WA474_24315 [Candidatus Sulfotelmatobacter sp.]
MDMDIDIEKKILRFATMTVAAACPAALALTQEQSRHASTGTLAPNGEVLAQRTRVSFAPQPSDQATELNVMDPIRESLGYIKTISCWGGFVAILILSFVFTARGGTKLLTTDPLTGLPLHPATDSRLHLGNEPTQLPESEVCRSKMQADFYSVYDSNVNATLAWYDAHLPGFKKTHAYAANRSQDTYYKSDGTLTVSVTGSPGKEGENADTYSVLYARLQPGLPEKTIVALNRQTVVCQ